jgi:hypothetical protein
MISRIVRKQPVQIFFSLKPHFFMHGDLISFMRHDFAQLFNQCFLTGIYFLFGLADINPCCAVHFRKFLSLP